MGINTIDRNTYGARESNGLVNPGAYHDSVDYGTTYTLRMLQDNGGKIVRLRLFSEYVPMVGKIVDVSYCHGELPNGQRVPVQLYIQPVAPWKLKGELIRECKTQGVYAKGLDLLNESNWSTVS